MTTLACNWMDDSNVILVAQGKLIPPFLDESI